MQEEGKNDVSILECLLLSYRAALARRDHKSTIPASGRHHLGIDRSRTVDHRRKPIDARAGYSVSWSLRTRAFVRNAAAASLTHEPQHISSAANRFETQLQKGRTHMSRAFSLHTAESAPEGSRAQLQQVAKSLGMIPNLAAVLAEAPAALEAYFTLGRIFDDTSFSATERQVVLLTVSTENGCNYCVAAHTAIAAMQKVPADVVDALRDGNAIADPKLEALRRLTAAIVAKRGRPGQAELDWFHAAGYGKRQLLEIIVGVGMKTISNYVNHLAETPLDAAFQKAAWTRPVAACAC